MNNEEFLRSLESSFVKFVHSGTSRSTAKLVPLHGAIAKDMHERLGSDYRIESQGYANGKEGTIQGRYINKKVDITISYHGKAVCGIAVKFVMQNYSQNSNNYFEGMLGETANIRSAKCPYFQLFAIPDKLPYYDKPGNIKHWEEFTSHNLQKYIVLDNDNSEICYHSPNKILIYVVHLPNIGLVRTKDEYLAAYSEYFSAHPSGFMTLTNVAQFRNLVIHNDYEQFAEKIYYTVMAR